MKCLNVQFKLDMESTMKNVKTKATKNKYLKMNMLIDKHFCFDLSEWYFQ